jgi:two-component system, cell cycle sensor histidine kinase and response regulator CckA
MIQNATTGQNQPDPPSSLDEAALRIQTLENELTHLRHELSELRDAQQTHAAPDQLLQTLMEQTPDQVYFKDLQSRFIRASKAVATSFHLADPEALQGKSDFDFFSQDHARRAYEDEQEIIRSGVPKMDMEEAETWPDGSTTWVSTTKVPFKDGAGSIIGTFGISRNITIRKQAEIALRIHEEKLRMVFDHAVDGILLGSPEGLIIEANSNACIMTGWPKEELLGQHISRIFSEGSLAKVPLRFDLLKAGHRVVSERALLRGDGSLLPIEMHTKMMPDGTYQAIVRDISARTEAEASYRGLFESVQEAIYILDRQGRFMDVNRGAVEMYGRPKDFFLGETPAVLSAPGRNDLEQVGRLIQQAFSGEPQHFEFWGIRANGQVFPKDIRVYNGTYFGKDVVIALAQDITERKNAEKALQTSEQHFRELLDRLHEGFAFTDRDEQFVFANPAASAIFGIPEGLTGHNLRDFLEPEAFQKVLRQTEIRRRGEKSQYELPIRQPNGETRTIALSVSPWLSEAGEYLGSTGLFQDITERKQAEDALRESETNFRNLLDKLGEGFAIVDAEERWTFTNPAAARIFGVEPGQLVGHSMREFVDEGTFQEILRQTARRRCGESSSYDIPIRRPDGEQRYLSLSASPYLGENGEYLGADGLFLDVTERRAAEQALRESQERYQELYRNTTDAIFWIRVEADGAFVIEDFNPAEEARLGKTSRELAGLALHAVMPKALADAVEVNFRRCVAAGHPIRYEEVVEFSSGSRTFQTLLVPIRDGGGRITRIVGFSQDITQSKQAEAALRQAQKLESLGVLAGGIAHDFNNLLTAMLGNLNLAQMKSSPESPARPYLENVERTVLKAAELTKQMLAYSGKGRFVVKPHNLNQVVQEMTHLLNVSISKKVLIRYDLARELPSIEADAAQIQQVVMNLVTNASEAIGDREGVISIATRLQSLDEDALQSLCTDQNLTPGCFAILEISDTGSGILPGIMGKIFDPFFSTKQSGRGLGLSAMQGILRGHHAGIWITSEPGKGSTFTLFFPAAQGTTAGTEAASAEYPESLFKGRILLVDDEPEVRNSTAAMLEALGLQVITAVDGQDALDRFKAERPNIDLILLDLTMPRMDGREAFRKLRGIQADIPVILYSGYSEHESLRETLAQGFAGFLQKPFQMTDLRQAIQQVRSRS